MPAFARLDISSADAKSSREQKLQHDALGEQYQVCRAVLLERGTEIRLDIAQTATNVRVECHGS
jgi:hypothetical protein